MSPMLTATLTPLIVGCGFVTGRPSFDTIPRNPCSTCGTRTWTALREGWAVVHWAAGEILVGGVFRTGDAASFVAAVSQSHNLRVVTRDQELVLQTMEADPPTQEDAPSNP
jgi:hypothetical protein